MESKFYIKHDDNTVECQLCPHLCRIKNERLGICNTRLNRNGVLESVQWGVIASSGLDPIEKKPLYHFHPGKMIYSIGGFGCNLNCPFCQNFEISQYVPHNIDKLRIISPSEVIQKSKIHKNSIGIAYTYNEPTIWFEYIEDTAKEAKKEGLLNVMVSNGFINPKPLDSLTVESEFKTLRVLPIGLMLPKYFSAISGVITIVCGFFSALATLPLKTLTLKMSKKFESAKKNLSS